MTDVVAQLMRQTAWTLQIIQGERTGDCRKGTGLLSRGEQVASRFPLRSDLQDQYRSSDIGEHRQIRTGSGADIAEMIGA